MSKPELTERDATRIAIFLLNGNQIDVARKREATPKPRTAPAQRAQAPKAAKAKPAGDMVWSQPLGHDLEEPEP